MNVHSFMSDSPTRIAVMDRNLNRCTPLELLTLSQGGDDKARHCLVARHQGLMIALAGRMTSNLSDAEDMSSEAYLRVYYVLNSCRNVDTLPAWIKRITINVCNRVYGETRRMHEVSLDFLTEIGGDCFVPTTETHPGKEVLEVLESDERLRRLYAAVRSLPTPYRDVTERYYLNSQSYQEISEQTGLTMGTIKSRLFRVRGELQRKLADLIL